MDLFFYFIVAVLGVIAGSFLTAYVARYGVKTMTRGRSACALCGTTLSPRELIPILSFIIQRGKCVHCESRISRMYLITEVLTSLMILLIFHTIFMNYGLTLGSVVLFMLYVSVFATLLAISLYDLKHFIIPDPWVYVFIGLGYVTHIYHLVYVGESITYLDIISGPLVALPFFLMWLVSRGTWMGFGDIKLSIGIGGLLGIVSGISALVLGVWIGTVISLGMLFFSHTGLSLGRGVKKLTMKSEVPFGPFLALGTLLAFVWFGDVLGLSLFI